MRIINHLKSDKVDFIKIKNICSLKDTIRNMSGTLQTERERLQSVCLKENQVGGT